MKVQPTSGLSVRIFNSATALALCIADRVCTLAEERRLAGGALVLGLAAGASPQETYGALERCVRTGRLDLSQCVAFCLDEYFPIDSESPLGFGHQMSGLAVRLGISRDRLHRLRGDLPRAAVESRCGEYEEQIRSAGGMDFQILGIGGTGHIGFNEPGSSRESRTRLVQLDERTRQDAAAAFGGLDRVPEEAVTMGVGTILDSREIALIAVGERKAAVVRHFVEGPVSPAVPASFLQVHDHATAYLDEESARLLDGTRQP